MHRPGRLPSIPFGWRERCQAIVFCCAGDGRCSDRLRELDGRGVGTGTLRQERDHVRLSELLVRHDETAEQRRQPDVPFHGQHYARSSHAEGLGALSSGDRQAAPSDSSSCLPSRGGRSRSKGLPSQHATSARTFPLPSRADNGLPCFGRGGRCVPFKTGGRAFYLGLYIGPRASPASIRALGKLVDEMKIKPR